MRSASRAEMSSTSESSPVRSAVRGLGATAVLRSGCALAHHASMRSAVISDLPRCAVRTNRWRNTPGTCVTTEASARACRRAQIAALCSAAAAVLAAAGSWRGGGLVRLRRSGARTRA